MSTLISGYIYGPLTQSYIIVQHDDLYVPFSAIVYVVPILYKYYS